MKRLISILLAVVLLAGCNTEIQLKEIPQTNESLTVYVNELDRHMSLAVGIFRAKYPEIPLEVISPKSSLAKSGDAWYEERDAMSAMLMAGEGPDLFCSSLNLNLEKAVYDGIVADMSEYYDADTTLDPSINKIVMDSGVIDGKRYYFPLEYSIPLLLSTEKTLEKYDLHPEECPDFLSFLSRTEKLIDKNVPIFPDIFNYIGVSNVSGIKHMNARDGIIDVGAPELRRAFEWAKKAVPQFELDYMFYAYMDTVDAENLKSVCAGESVFTWPDSIYCSVGYPTYARICKLLSSIDEEPALFPIRNISGGLTASVTSAVSVRANSPNRENAYKFIQILLSEELQSHHSLRGIHSVSVVRSAMDSYYKNTIDWIFGEVQGFPSERPHLSEEQHQAYLAYIDEIDTVMLDPTANNLGSKMIPYFLGEQEYDECLAAVKEKLEFRMSE